MRHRGVVPAMLLPDGLASAASLLEAVTQALYELRRCGAIAGDRYVCRG